MVNWIVLDCSYLVYRAQYAIREGDAVWGFVATLNKLRDRFDSDNFVFCFDSANGLIRNEMLPTYKEKRRINPEHEEAHLEAKKSMNILRTRLLKQWGFENILYQEGYEADDLIASVVLNSLYEEDEAVIVSSDTDLFQLLEPSVVCYNPTKEELTTHKTFKEQWGIRPTDWPNVKGIAGCSSDNIKGVQGVGEKSAAAYLAGKLPNHHKKYEAIAKSSKDEFEERLKLVRLPLEGTEEFDLIEEEDINWRKLESYSGD